MLADRYSQETIAKLLLPHERWHPFPRLDERESWAYIQRSPQGMRRREYVVNEARRALAQPWPQLPATLYLDFIRTGDRARFQEAWFERRRRLALYVLAECYEDERRFIDPIVDAVWAITEEATWCMPAHLWAARRLGMWDRLPRPERAYVDLFAAETGQLLATTLDMVGPRLDAITPHIRARVEHAVHARLLEPVMTRNDFQWWQGDNNWTPWICSNLLLAGYHLLKDQDQAAALTGRLMEPVDNYIGGQPEDGGCDEGTMYWNVATGALLMFLEWLHHRTNGAIDIYDEPKIRAMARYIVVSHLDGPHWITFADVRAGRHRVPAIFRLGHRLEDPKLENLALLVRHQHCDPTREIDPPVGVSPIRGPLTDTLAELFWVPDAPARQPDKPLDTFLPQTQIWVARETTQANRGLVVAAKGGHNAESHNHNDVGQFIVMLDGTPFIIDVGSAEYTRHTFGPERYELWHTRGSAHNAPVIGGMEQAAGRRRAASGVQHQHSAACSVLSMDLCDTYPPSLQCRRAHRTIGLERETQVLLSVRDELRLGQPATIRLVLLTQAEVIVDEWGALRLQHDGQDLWLRYDAVALHLNVETQQLRDPVLREAWGPQLRRLVFETPEPRTALSYNLQFARGR